VRADVRACEHNRARGVVRNAKGWASSYRRLPCACWSPGAASSSPLPPAAPRSRPPNLRDTCCQRSHTHVQGPPEPKARRRAHLQQLEQQQHHHSAGTRGCGCPSACETTSHLCKRLLRQWFRVGDRSQNRGEGSSSSRFATLAAYVWDSCIHFMSPDFLRVSAACTYPSWRRPPCR
jgi:hypothetical protein